MTGQTASPGAPPGLDLDPVAVWTAQADAAEAEGRAREPYGGGVAEFPGVRLMASGLPNPQWNAGDVTDPALVDLDAVRAWFAARGVPWNLRIPAGVRWAHGRRATRRRCMGLHPEAFRAVRSALSPAGLSVRAARADEVELVARVDAEAFGDPVEPNLGWVRPQLGADGFLILLALLDGAPVGVATGVRTSGPGGECVGIYGVGVLEPARRRGIGAALTCHLLRWGFDTGATLAHLNPETEDAARLYTRLGFTEVPGLDVYLDMS
ncbi:GNAT family N-acetyltransferase [Actinopolymorpha alba]|uniref:GNAT family N-acetyltransferase n=1 Tax=Actinopolymorpha alba TaxID=533267 RepID=UPI000371C6C8|nr:GNAT family N-acetyltransferase [Actinopolymorpha alba]